MREMSADDLLSPFLMGSSEKDVFFYLKNSLQYRYFSHIPDNGNMLQINAGYLLPNVTIILWKFPVISYTYHEQKNENKIKQ